MRALINYIKGNLSAFLLYPASQIYQKRKISEKARALDKYYRNAYEARKKKNLESLILMLAFAKEHVPYYRDLFKSIRFSPERLRDDFNHFCSIPFLTKDILAEQGSRMFREDAANYRSYAFKTGGSTGKSAHIYYDQEALDWSSAVTVYARQRIGHKQWKKEVHFASRFPEEFPLKDRVKEHLKCFIMNRHNIFFDSLDDNALSEIWKELRRLRPNLIHAHPSTIYALANWVARNNESKNLFDVFESSGELLDQKKRSTIADAIGCKVVDRYGLAEFGVAAYQLEDEGDLQVFDNFVYPESALLDADNQTPEIILTGLKNYFMPLVRYRTGDRGEVAETGEGMIIRNITGRIHDFVVINNRQYPTHYVQDVIDRVGGIQEFQIINTHDTGMRLLLVPESNADRQQIVTRIKTYWDDAFEIVFIDHSELVTVGWRDKFRYVVNQ